MNKLKRLLISKAGDAYIYWNFFFPEHKSICPLDRERRQRQQISFFISRLGRRKRINGLIAWHRVVIRSRLPLTVGCRASAIISATSESHRVSPKAARETGFYRFVIVHGRVSSLAMPWKDALYFALSYERIHLSYEWFKIRNII